MGRAVRQFQVTQESNRDEAFRLDAELLLRFPDGCIFRGLPCFDVPARPADGAFLLACAAEEPAILNNENADAIIGVGIQIFIIEGRIRKAVILIFFFP